MKTNMRSYQQLDKSGLQKPIEATLCKFSFKTTAQNPIDGALTKGEWCVCHSHAAPQTPVLALCHLDMLVRFLTRATNYGHKTG